MRFRAGEKELRFHFLMGKAPGALENPFLERNSLMMGGIWVCLCVCVSFRRSNRTTFNQKTPKCS